MKIKRTIAAAACLALPLAACGADDDAVPGATDLDGDVEEGEGAGEPSNGEAVQLALWTQTGSEETQQAMRDAAAEYSEMTDGVVVDVEIRSTDPHKEALRQSAGSEAAPDIYFMWTGLGLGGEFVEAGVSRPIDDYYEQYGWDDRFVPSALEAVREYGDETHGVPWNIMTMNLIYRNDLFAEHGVSEPQTYDELIEANEQLAAAGIAPIQFGGSVDWHLMRLLDSLMETICGPETHDALKNLEADWSQEPCVTESFEELKVWTDEYVAEGFIGLDNTESSQLVYADRAAMMLEGPWMVNQIQEAGQDIADYTMIPFPTDTNRLYLFTEAFYISTDSQHPDEAAAFLDWLTSDETMEAYAPELPGGGVMASPRQDTDRGQDNPQITEDWLDLLQAENDGSYLPGDQSLPLDVTTEFWRVQNSVATDAMSPDEAGAAMQQFIDNR
jgi:raffinose/stachyose/melibiose transport system substrate-binding protein